MAGFVRKLISIITPVHNSQNTITDCISSVLSQTYYQWEMLIVDDCSTDETYNIIEHYLQTDLRIKYIRLDEQSGAAVARNTGISRSRGAYIAFLDSDDLWLPKKIEKQLKFIRDNNLTLSCSSYYTIDERGNRINTRIVKESISYIDMLKSNNIGNLTGLYDCEKLGKIYMDNVGHEDYTLWLKIMKKVRKTKAVTEPLAEYRIVSNSISANKFKVLKWQWNVYRNILKLDVFRSTYYFICYVYFAFKKRR